MPLIAPAVDGVPPEKSADIHVKLYCQEPEGQLPLALVRRWEFVPGIALATNSGHHRQRQSVLPTLLAVAIRMEAERFNSQFIERLSNAAQRKETPIHASVSG